MSTTEEPIRFTIKRRTKVVEIEVQEENGSMALHVLHVREITGGEKDEYRNFVNAKERHASGVPKDVRGIPEQWILTCVRDSNGQKLDPKFVASWPSGLRDRLDALCDEVNSTYEKVADAKKV